MFSFCLDAESKKNAEIARQMKDGKKQAKKKITILILGTGDSGKTTLRKQLLNLHTDQFQKAEFRTNFANIVLGNLIDGTVEVLGHMGKKGEEISVLKDTAREIGNELTPELHAKLKQVIWDDPEFMQLATQSGKDNKLQLQDCYLVFAKELKDQIGWGLHGWVPSIDDCVRSRVRTSGVCSDTCNVNGVPFTFYDVGGQRAERRKWMHSFDTCTAAIFVTSISEYDQNLFEDRTMNRLQEAVELFKECVNSPWLSKTTMILFLNKQDLFLKKFLVDKIPLNVSGRFPTAPEKQETEEDFKAAIDWITDLFTSQKAIPTADSGGPKEDSVIYVYVTTATDPNNVKTVFNVCKDIVLKSNLNQFGFTV